MCSFRVIFSENTTTLADSVHKVQYYNKDLKVKDYRIDEIVTM